jgi:hypothetical protein
MARIRSVKPETFTSFTLSRVPIEARFLFVGLWTEADDEGKLIDSAKLLAGSLFPHDENVTALKVERWLNALAEIGSIQRYEVDGARYIQVSEWGHQKISHPGTSRIPSPSGNTPESLPKNTGDSPEFLRPDLGSRIIGSRRGVSATPKRNATTIPDDFAIDDSMRLWADEKYPSVNLESETEHWIDWAKANGKTFRDHKAAWRTWMRNSVKFRRGGAQQQRETYT